MLELKGFPVIKDMERQFYGDIDTLSKQGILPTLCVVRLEERADDLAYERGIQKRFSSVGAVVKTVVLPETVEWEELNRIISKLNDDSSINGILLFRPLPKRLSGRPVGSLIIPGKDVDGMCLLNEALVFCGSSEGYPPCTAQAVVELLNYYKIDPCGKRVVIIGRSMVVGKPLSMLLLAKNATVTICHTKTRELEEECRRADILIACAGAKQLVGRNFVHPNQVVIDVGVHPEGDRLCGDVNYDEVSSIVSAITPVPGGVGTITNSVLLKHTIQSAFRQLSEQA